MSSSIFVGEKGENLISSSVRAHKNVNDLSPLTQGQHFRMLVACLNVEGWWQLESSIDTNNTYHEGYNEELKNNGWYGCRKFADDS